MIGGEGEYEDVAAAVKYVVYGTQNEVKLHRALADATITALVVYAEGETLPRRCLCARVPTLGC